MLPHNVFETCHKQVGAHCSAVSKHLKVLERAGLIERGRERQWRPARLQAEPLRAVAEWTLGYREFWEERYDRLDEYLEELQGRGDERKEEDDDR